MGPLAHWEVDLAFDFANMPDGEERPLFLYPLPSAASISECSFTQGDEPLGPQPTVQALDQLPEEAQPPTPSKGLMVAFATESLPILSLGLESYLAAYKEGEPVLVRLVYGNGLPTVDGRIRLRIPGRVDPSLEVDGATEVAVQIAIEDGEELVDDPESSVPLERRKEGDVVTLEDEALGVLDVDIEVSFRPGRTEMPVTRLRRSDEHFLFSIFPPTSIPASPQRRDLVFCVDASENVLSGLFDIIRDDLASTLRKLDDNDRFALVTYGRDIDGYEGGEFCEVGKVEEACRWLEKIEPKGRADIQPLLARIQALPSQPDRQLCIFLLAAGHVGNEPAILKGLDFDQSDRRYYAVGIGPSVQQAFLRRLSLLARGRCEVAPQGHCAEALGRLLGQTRALLAEVTFEGQDGNDFTLDKESLVPSRMPSLTPQGPVHCLGQGSPPSLRFRSKDETGVFFAGTVNARTTENPALRGVWAGMKVREMLDSVRLSTGAKRKQLRAETSALASSHGILVEDTVLVLDTGEGLDVQLSALPYRWRKGGPPVAKTEEDSTPAFDWRKGLKARDGLFKGARPGEEGDMRAGLRRPGESSSKPAKGGRDASKPMLDRYGMANSVPLDEEEDDDVVLEAPVEATPEEEASPSEVSSEGELSTEPEVSQETEAGEVTTEIGAQNFNPFEAPSEDETAAESSEASGAEATEATEAVESIDLVAEEESAEIVEEPVASNEPEEAIGKVEAVEEATPSEEVAAPPVDESAEASPVVAPQASPETGDEGQPVAVAVAPRLVALPAQADPVFQYVADPMAEARLRMDSYLEQAGSVETRMALASLAALPSEVGGSGADLPRILAQTVGHLEKRGYYSSAVSVLGLLLRDYASPEVTKKMESLLVGWANSLEAEKTPEAIHILQAGLRICPGSEALAGALEGHWSRWNERAAQQSELPEVAQWRQTVAATDPPAEPLLSSAQLEILRLRQQQQQMADEVASLKATLDERLGGLPGMLEKLLEARPVVVQAAPLSPPPVPVASPVSVPDLDGEEEPLIESVPIIKPLAAAPVVVQAPAVEDEPLPIDLPLPEPVPTPEPVALVEEEPIRSEVTASVVEEEPLPIDLPLPEPEPVSAVVEPPTEGQAEVASTEALEEAELPALDIPMPEVEAETVLEAPAESVVEPVVELAEVVIEPVAEVGAVEAPESAVETLPPSEEAGSLEQAAEVVASPDPAPVEAVEEAPAAEVPIAEVEAETDEDSGESLNLTRDELLELLQAEPNDASGHRAVKTAFPDTKDRINFYRDLVRLDAGQIYHSLSLARAYREADQTKVAVVHFQKFLRSEKDAAAYLELADAYDELGKANLSVSARKAAELLS